MRVVLVVLGLLFPAAAFAQAADEQTYADIRAELDLLKNQIQLLRNELITATPEQTGVANAGPLMVRVDQIEEELRDLTGQVEQLGFRIDAVVKDGTNRIGDLEFRLTELEGGDFSTLGETKPLGEGGQAPLAVPQDNAGQIAGVAPQTIDGSIRPRTRSGADGQAIAPQPVTPLPVAETQDAVAPQGGFDAALAAYRAGNYTEAIVGFDSYIQTQPAGPQVSEAAYWKGEALAAQGSWNMAARSYLDSFSGAPQGAKAPEALLRLGVSLGRLGQFSEACMTLGEVGKRFPNAGGDLADRTASEMRALNCT